MLAQSQKLKRKGSRDAKIKLPFLDLLYQVLSIVL
eukprot:COSAG05_NODE_3286_length_2176_cov_7.519981_1_plen_34_part_10